MHNMKMRFAPWLMSAILGGCLVVADSQTRPSVCSYSIENTKKSVAPNANETLAHRNARMKWWREARFGMFIHWGLYAVPAGTWKGAQVKGLGEWIMRNGKIPVADYSA